MNWGTRIFSPLHLCPVVVSEGVHKLSPLPQCPTTSKNHPRSQTPHKIKAGPCGSCMAVQLLHKPAGSPDFPVGANPYSLPSTLPVCKYVSRSQLPGKLTRQSRAKGSWRKQGLPAHRAQTGAAWAPAAGRLARGRVGRNSQAEGGPPCSGSPRGRDYQSHGARVSCSGPLCHRAVVLIKGVFGFLGIFGSRRLSGCHS